MHGITFEEAGKRMVQQSSKRFQTPFKDILYAFHNQFVARKKQKKNFACLLSISQKNGENFGSTSNSERLEVGTCSDDVAMVTFTKGLKREKTRTR